MRSVALLGFPVDWVGDLNVQPLRLWVVAGVKNFRVSVKDLLDITLNVAKYKSCLKMQQEECYEDAFIVHFDGGFNTMVLLYLK